MYLTNEIIERVLKKQTASKKNSNTHRNKNVSAIIFYHWKNSLVLISIAKENLLEACAFLNNVISLGIHLLGKTIFHIL